MSPAWSDSSLPLSHAGSLNAALSDIESLCSFHRFDLPPLVEQENQYQSFHSGIPGWSEPFISSDKGAKERGWKYF